VNALHGKLYRYTHGVDGSVLLTGLATTQDEAEYGGWTGPWDESPPPTDLYCAGYRLSEDKVVFVVNAEYPVDLALLVLERKGQA